MRLAEILTSERIETGTTVSTKADALRMVSELLARGDEPVEASRLLEVLEERERLASTGVGSGVAIPHGRVSDLSSLRAALLIAAEGVPFEAVDGQPVRIVVGVLAPQQHTGDHLKVLARISRLLRQEGIRERLLASESAAEALALVEEEDAKL